jgi:hypothetical protein
MRGIQPVAQSEEPSVTDRFVVVFIPRTHAPFLSHQGRSWLLSLALVMACLLRVAEQSRFHRVTQVVRRLIPSTAANDPAVLGSPHLMTGEDGLHREALTIVGVLGGVGFNNGPEVPTLAPSELDSQPLDFGERSTGCSALDT